MARRSSSRAPRGRRYYSFSDSGDTIAGLGDLFTWNKVSPRLGVNLKLGQERQDGPARDGRPVLPPAVPERLSQRASGHRAGPPWPGTIQPPRATRRSSRSRIRARTSPSIRTWTRPGPTEDSIGIDRELMRNLGVSVSVVHKRWGDQIGWVGHRRGVRHADRGDAGRPDDGVSAAQCHVRAEVPAAPTHQAGSTGTAA